MNSFYTVRDECIICKHKEFTKYFENDYSTYLSFSLFNEIKNDAVSIPFNIISCNKCHIIQTLYIGDINTIYGNNHVDDYGSTKNEINEGFSEFILRNKYIINPIEVGACKNSLSKLIMKNSDILYTIIEPGYRGDFVEKLTIINNYCENVDFKLLNGNTMIMSAVFEHFYNPVNILEKLRDATNIQYIYLNHPNFEYFCNNDINNILNFEHIYYIELDFLKQLFKLYGFKIDEIYDYKNNYYFLKFIRLEDYVLSNDITFNNITSYNDTVNYFNRMHTRINKLNTMLQDSTSKYYIWPTSAHTVTLFMNGLQWNKLAGILDNSPNKIGKFMYGYNLQCESMNDKLIENTRENITIILTGAGLYLNELNITNSKLKIINFNEL